MPRITVYRWAKERGIVPQVAYGWRNSGLPVDADGRVDPNQADAWLAHRREAPRRRPARTPDRNLSLSELVAREEESVIKGLCSLGFLRAQGRTLASGSQQVFLDMVWREVYPALPGIRCRDEFDHLHEKWVAQLQRVLQTRSGGQLSYGQGQKSLNVALKFIVDWASRPDTPTADRLRPWLHCPLDSVVMTYLRDLHPDHYRTRIASFYPGVYGQQRFLLAAMNVQAYRAWQDWIRDLLPSKPVILDVVWVFERPGSGNSSQGSSV